MFRYEDLVSPCHFVPIITSFSECNCSLGSLNSSCSDDGICYCQPGVTRTYCDQCLPFHSNLSSSGCQPCAGCENILALQLSRATTTINSVQQNYSLYLRLTNVDLATNLLVNSSLWDLMVMRSMLFDALYVVQTDLNILNGTALNSLVFRSLTTEDQVSHYKTYSTYRVNINFNFRLQTPY